MAFYRKKEYGFFLWIASHIKAVFDMFRYMTHEKWKSIKALSWAFHGQMSASLNQSVLKKCVIFNFFSSEFILDGITSLFFHYAWYGIVYTRRFIYIQDTTDTHSSTVNAYLVHFRLNDFTQEKGTITRRWRQTSGTICTWILTSNVLKHIVEPHKLVYVSNSSVPGL